MAQTSRPRSADVSEVVLRDYLAANLDLIEPGLSLIGVEHPLRGREGAGGVVDIFCRDPYEHYVFIEVKRSDSAARSALHQLHKYPSLLRDAGIASECIRFILISTTWHELATAYAGYRENSPYPTDAYIAHPRSAPGDPFACELEKIEPARLAGTLEMCPIHLVLLFDCERTRDENVRPLMDELARHDIEDAVVVTMDCVDDPESWFPYAQYLAIGRIAGRHREGWIGRLPEEVRETFRESRWGLEDHVLGRVLRRHRVHQDSEASEPSRFADKMQGWQTRRVHRAGRFADEAVPRPDDEILRMLMGVFEDNRFTFFGRANSRFEPSWNRFLAGMLRLIDPDSDWYAGLMETLGEAAETASDIDVAAYVFQPRNCLTGILMAAEHSSELHLPQLHVKIRDAANGRTTLLEGRLGWAGVRKPQPVDTLLAPFGPERFHAFEAMATGEMEEHEERLLAGLGLRHVLKRTEVDRHGFADVYYFAPHPEGLWTADPSRAGGSVADYIAAHPALLAELRALFAEHTQGILN